MYPVPPIYYVCMCVCFYVVGVLGLQYCKHLYVFFVTNSLCVYVCVSVVGVLGLRKCKYLYVFCVTNSLCVYVCVSLL